MKILTLDPTDQIVNNSFLQYGLLGVIALLLGYFAFLQYKRLVERNDALEKKVDNLQRDMMGILVEERDRLSKLISDNTAALSDLQKTIYRVLLMSNKGGNSE
jgi:hypothetical protein